MSSLKALNACILTILSEQVLSDFRHSFCNYFKKRDIVAILIKICIRQEILSSYLVMQILRWMKTLLLGS